MNAQSSMAHRLEPSELQTMSIVILRGISEVTPSLCAIGWIEDDKEEVAALTLHEPIYFMQMPPEAPTKENQSPPTRIQFLLPQLELPVKTQFHEYSKVEYYDGISDIGALYIKAVLYCRQLKTNYAAAWAVADIKHITQPMLPIQR